MGHNLDEIDKRILYHLAAEARHTSAPDITEEVDVSPATIRNRINQLEERGVIRGYHANIDYEQTDGRLTYLFICNADPPHREQYASEALQIPGVIHVRNLMSGRRNVQIEVVGEDKEEINRISRALSKLGLDIEDEALVESEFHHPYQPFGPESALVQEGQRFTNLHELAGEAKVLDITVSQSSEAAGRTVRELSDSGALPDDILLVAIERGDDIITPNGLTEIESGDVITVFSQNGDAESLVKLFGGGGRIDSSGKPSNVNS